jgi:hypothetical protein
LLNFIKIVYILAQKILFSIAAKFKNCPHGRRGISSLVLSQDFILPQSAETFSVKKKGRLGRKSALGSGIRATHQD